MDPKLRDLAGRTNLDELIRPAAREVDLNQPVETAEPLDTQPARSTYDPVQINLATVDIAGNLIRSRRSWALRAFALVFVGGPTMFLGLWFIVEACTSPDATLPGRAAGLVFGLAMAGFWPWIILGRRRRTPSSNG